MERITEKILRGTVERLNKLEDKPVEPWSKSEDGSYKANIGNYHLDMAYGGVQLVQHVTLGGGIRVISSGGYMPKRELYYQIHTMFNFIFNQDR
ncbi:MAG: hypothetical protein KAS32_29755 [Candidatus Peribacteraceae bacterium]|nr:hypothetical protein [Candidatus Peribacteraceae bacterium]